MRTPSRLAAAGVLVAGFVLAAAGTASADATANAVATDSPGFLSGNIVQVPIDADLNVCGNSVNVVGVLNPAVGNRCANGDHAVAWHHTVWHHWWHHDDDAAADDRDCD
ncbi:chaplin [Streptacidiphilus rugosus]|uniref:chaplin n=1 Tax=Streptacidiphilus rugosus TaxID=405783 RepID=UPI00068F196F|nr:chaplin [Streptacidiphilus rugosus]